MGSVKLDYQDKHSVTWKKVVEFAEERISQLRAKNDGMLDELTTANIRGRIAAYKELVALEEAPPQLTDE